MWPFSRKPRLDEFGRSPLHYAAADNDLAAFRAELARADADAVNLADRAGWTPLHFAAQVQSAEMIKLLLERGAAVDPVDRHGNTPLMTAVSKYGGDPAPIAALRAAGADPMRKNNYGVCPLVSARQVANFDVATCFADLPPQAAEA